MIGVPCPGCHVTLDCPEAAVGKPGRCKRCLTVFLIAAAVDEAGPRRDAGVPRSRRWYRAACPASFLLALVLLPLPFVELRCDGKPIVRQSGLQMITGDLSLTEAGEGMRAQMAKAAGANPDAGKPGPATAGAKDDRSTTAPLMLPFALCVLAGLVASLVCRRLPLRTAAVGSFATLAALLLAVQLLVGFPLDRLARDVGTEAAKQTENKGDRPEALAASIVSALAVDTRYTTWFYIAVLATLAPLPLLAREWWTARGSAPTARSG